MDVTLVLTHRCNLDCGYCYAGEHHKTDMNNSVAKRGIELMFADNSQTVQLGFFGGEPLLRFESLRSAVLRAKARATAEGRQLAIQLTTNGAAIRPEHVAFFSEHKVRVTVSIDGIAEAHDLNRPKAGGGSSFEQVLRGLRQLIGAGLAPQAMMVITPETAPYVYRSVSFLWTEGVATVRGNLALTANWGQQERDELQEQLTSTGIELTTRRLRGESIRFQPFDVGMGPLASASLCDTVRQPARRVTTPSGSPSLSHRHCSCCRIDGRRSGDDSLGTLWTKGSSRAPTRAALAFVQQ